MNPPRGFEAKGAHWVKPDLVAEIAFTEWSDDGALRHPSFQGLRADKKATDVVREEPQAARLASAAAKAPGARDAKSATTNDGREATRKPTVAGVAISHPDKLYFPEAGITKIEVAQYARADGVVDPAARRGSPAVAGPLSRWLEPAVLLSEARRQERERRSRPHRGAGRRRDRDVHGREQRQGARRAASSGACSNCIRGARARLASTARIG